MSIVGLCWEADLRLRRNNTESGRHCESLGGPKKGPRFPGFGAGLQKRRLDKHTMSGRWVGGHLLHRNWCALIPQVCTSVEDGMLLVCSARCIRATADAIFHGKQKRRMDGASVQS